MAPQLSEREQVAQVRRVAKRRPPVSAAIVAEAASRTPLITRFIRAQERRVEPARGDSLSVATTPDTLAVKNQCDTSGRIDGQEKVIGNNANNTSLSHTAFTPSKRIMCFSQLKGRRDIYDLPEDDRSALTTAPIRQAPSAQPHKLTATKSFPSEPLTSSFRYPETPSSLQRKEGRTLDECLNAVRKVSRIVQNETCKTQTLILAKGDVASGVEEVMRAKAQDPILYPQQENLTELDLEILHLGEDNHDATSSNSPSSSERARTAIQQMHHDDFGQFVNDVDNESDAHAEEPSRKRRRSSRQIPNVEARNAGLDQLTSERRSRADGKFARNKSGSQKKPSKSHNFKKKKRRLPVNELVTLTERPGDSDIEMTSGAQAELSQDPIYQQADESDPERSERQSHEAGFRLKIKIRPRKRFGGIDISLFRMPEHRGPATARDGSIISSYSDGFEGKEAAPIGLYMPVKYTTRRQKLYQKITLKFDKLTLVSERPLEEHEVDPQHRAKRTGRRQKAGLTPNTHDESAAARDHRGHRNREVERPDAEYGLLENAMADNDEDQMLLDGPDEEITGDIRVRQEHQQLLKTAVKVQTTPSLPSIEVTTETPEHLVSPLKRKQSAFHDSTRSAESSQILQKSASQRPQELLGKEASVRISQMLTAASAIKKTRVRARTGSLEIADQLMMVSVQRRPSESKYDTESSEEESDSDRESAETYSEPEEENEEASEDNDESLVPEDSDHNEEEDAEGEESQHAEFVAEVVTDDVNPENLFKNVSFDGITTGLKSAGAPLNSEANRAEDRGDRVSSFVQENQDTRGEPSETTQASLAQMASQALLAMNRAEVEKQPQSALQSNNGQDDDAAFAMLDLDSSWRPRTPDTSGPSMQVDEDIIDSPAPAPSQGGRTVCHRSSRRRSGFRSQQLTMIRSRQHSPIPDGERTDERGTQESVELGQEGRNDRRSSSEAVFETQLNNIPEIQETQFSVVPQLDYMERARIHLSQLFPRQNLRRAKSMPIQAYSAQKGQVCGEIMAGGVNMTAAFQHTVSPAKSPSHMLTLLEEGSSVKKSLSSLTKQASLNMGTLPGSVRTRTPSLQLKSPFLRSTL